LTKSYIIFKVREKEEYFTNNKALTPYIKMCT